ncbi:hypothetical protein LOB72_04765 [Lactobacillus delbrueckii subsp. lactis]|uniref:Rib/alpha-like domain-containing protein n=1 Tax=Lactobacillus delbrueckii TaxID=1584 RepID=UPI001E3E0170|nr:Rib/alpha-like domain-containing protein [Lactobacillus delbrueckii]MCD5448069.1 hypothetical protein [Lactobacillus delbrueckii subsp. lactis]
MPKKTSFRFARVPNFKWAGSYYTAVLVTYPDKSQEYTRQVKVTVKRQKDKACYQVKVRPGQVTLGQKLSPSQLVTNLSSLPKKSKETSAFLTVTVNNPADSSRYTPVLLAAKTQVGKAIAASSLIANFA